MDIISLHCWDMLIYLELRDAADPYIHCVHGTQVVSGSLIVFLHPIYIIPMLPQNCWHNLNHHTINILPFLVEIAPRDQKRCRALLAVSCTHFPVEKSANIM